MKIDNINRLDFDIIHENSIKKGEEGFEDLLKDFIIDVNNDLHKASRAQSKLMEGKVDNMIEIIATIEKAGISLQFATEIRNKALEAYQEIMRMQV